MLKPMTAPGRLRPEAHRSESPARAWQVLCQRDAFLLQGHSSPHACSWQEPQRRVRQSRSLLSWFLDELQALRSLRTPARERQRALPDFQSKNPIQRQRFLLLAPAGVATAAAQAEGRKSTPAL